MSNVSDREMTLTIIADMHAQHVEAHKLMADAGMPAEIILDQIMKTFRSSHWVAMLEKTTAVKDGREFMITPRICADEGESS